MLSVIIVVNFITYTTQNPIVVTSSWEWTFDATWSLSVPSAVTSWKVCLEFSAAVSDIRVSIIRDFYLLPFKCFMFV